MIRRRLRLVLMLLGAATLTAAARPVAQTPNPNTNYAGCHAFVSDATVVPGQPVTVTGSGAGSGDVVTGVMGATIGTGVADAAGNFSFAATIPATAEGTDTLSVRCGPNGGMAVITVTVGSPGEGPSVTTGTGDGAPPLKAGVPGKGSLARTGADNLIPLAKLSVVLIVAGGLVLAASRRRRSASPAAS